MQIANANFTNQHTSLSFRKQEIFCNNMEILHCCNVKKCCENTLQEVNWFHTKWGPCIEKFTVEWWVMILQWIKWTQFTLVLYNIRAPTLINHRSIWNWNRDIPPGNKYRCIVYCNRGIEKFSTAEHYNSHHCWWTAACLLKLAQGTACLIYCLLQLTKLVEAQILLQSRIWDEENEKNYRKKS